MAWLLERKELRAKIDRADGTAEERARVTAKIEALDADLRKAEDRHREATAPLVARLRELAAFDSDAFDAKLKLQQSIDSDLRQRYADLERREREVVAKQNELAEYMNQAKLGAVALKDKAAYDHGYDAKSCLAQAERCEANAKHYASELQPVEQHLLDLANEREQLDRLALTP